MYFKMLHHAGSKLFLKNTYKSVLFIVDCRKGKQELQKKEW